MAARTRVVVAIAAAVALAITLKHLLADRAVEPHRSPAPESRQTASGTAPEDASPAAVPEPPPTGPVESDDPRVGGLVVDFEGRPVPEATVRLGASSTTSGGDGTFSLPAPEFSGRGSGGVVVAFKEGHGTGQEEIQRGRTRTVRIVLPPCAGIVGEVLSPEGPVAGARVQLHDGAWSRVVTTGADGAFRFPEARTLRCEVAASADGFRSGGARLSPAIATRKVRIWLERREDFPLRVVDGAGLPVAGAEYTVTVSQGMDEFRIVGATDEHGLAMRLPLPEWSNHVGVRATGFLPVFSRNPRFLKDEGEFRIVLHERSIDLEVQAVGGGGAEEWRRWSVALGANPQAPPPDAQPGFGQFASSGVSVLEDSWVALDAEGRATLRNVGQFGAIAIVAAMRGASGGQESFRVVVWRTDRLAIDTRLVEWTPPRFTRVAITTREAGSGGGVSARVIVRMDDETTAAREKEMPGSGGRFREEIRTGADGRTTLWLWPGKYTVEAYGGIGTSGDVTASATATVGEVETAVEILLPAMHSIHGVLRTESGIPLPGRQVFVNSVSREPAKYFAAFTDAAGAFEVRGVPPGTHEVRWDGARGEGHHHGPRGIVVPCEPLVLVAPTCTLRGTVQPAPGGRAVVALSPSLRDGSLTRVVREPLDDAGGFEAAGLAPGPWVVEVLDAQGRVIGRSTVDVFEGARVSVALE